MQVYLAKKRVQTDDPAFLPVGTPISAKFKGAFCEASVKSVDRSVKVKVTYKKAPFGTAWLDYDDVTGDSIEMNGAVMAAVAGNDAKRVKAVISVIKDHSVYTVSFDDGDERTLRRSQLCPKGKRHFDDTLDTMPLSKPEDFYTPHVVTPSASSPTGVPPADRRPKKIGRPPKKRKEENVKPEPEVVENGAADSERDSFVARWYKYREDCSQPANSTPQLGRADVDLYAMYSTVRALGGFTKVDNNAMWPNALTLMKLPAAQAVTVPMLKKCYKKYMSEFEHFVRHHGWNMAGNETHSPRHRTPSGRPAVQPRSLELSANESSADEPPVASGKARPGRKRSSIAPSRGAKKARGERERSASSTLSLDHRASRAATSSTTNDQMVTIMRVEQAVLRNGHRCWLGQKCRAKYKGTLYQARVQLLEARAVDELADNCAVVQLPLHRVKVHYHGWKARFDEWLTDDDLDVAETQDCASAPPRLPTSLPPTDEPSTSVQKAFVAKTTRPPPRRRTAARSPLITNGCTSEDDKTSVKSEVGGTRVVDEVVKEESSPPPEVDVKVETVTKRGTRGKREREPTVEMILPPAVVEKSSRQSSVRPSRTAPELVDDVKPAVVVDDAVPSTSTTPEEKPIASSSDEEGEDEEEEDIKSAAPRVTRAKAAANPAEHLRKWSRQNPLLLEEEPRPPSSANVVVVEERPTATTRRPPPRTRTMTNESVGSMTTVVEEVTIAVSASMAMEMETPPTIVVKEESTSPANESPPVSSSPASKTTRTNVGRNRVKRRVSNLKNHKAANDSEEDTPTKEANASPPKDTINALKAKVLQKLLEENYDFAANVEKVVMLDASLTFEESIEQLKRRMEKARRGHSSRRAKLLKMDTFFRNKAARTSSCTDEGEAKASPSSEGVSSSPPIALPSIESE